MIFGILPYSKVKTLGESDSDDEGTLAWVIKNRKLVKEREMADKRVGESQLHLSKTFTRAATPGVLLK